jgi:hypothetical protein
MGLAQHEPPLPELDQPQQLQQLTAALAQHKVGDSPPCGSRLLPCAALLWLVPAVLLEWLQKQPTGGPNAGWYCQMFSAQLYMGLNLVKKYRQFWERAERMCAAAAQQQENTASSMLDASRVAGAISNAGKVPASHLVQLLQLASRAGARIMACMQAPRSLATPEGNSSSFSGSIRLISGRNRGYHSGAVQQAPYADLVEKQLGSAFWHMSHALCPLLAMVNRTLTMHADVEHAAASHSTSDGMAGSGRGQASQDSKQTDVASLCTALQLALPQLITVSEAAVRIGVGGGSDLYDILLHGAVVMQEVSSQGLFVAVGLQPGSPAVKPLSGLVLTMLKHASVAMLTKPQPDSDTAEAAIACLCSAVGLNSLVLQSVSGSNGSCSTPDPLISMLVRSALFPGNRDDMGSVHRFAERLSIISGSTALTATSISSDSDTFVPWLVSLGRCCMVHALLLQRTLTNAAAAWGTAAHSTDGQKNMENIAQALQEVAAVLPAWLQSDSVSAQRTAAGYSTQRVIELMQSVVQPGQGASQAGPAAAVPHELLHDLGLALCNMPVGTACNNPHCTSLAGLSEQQLVVGRARLCAGCLVARYCCRACQVAAWKQHKPACKAVASAHAAKPAEQEA